MGSNSVNEVRKAQRADGPATIMAIGLANPPNTMEQSSYADFLFRVTGNEDKVEFKEKYERICKGPDRQGAIMKRTMIKKRYFYHTEELLKKHPNLCEYEAPSLNTRQDIVLTEVPKLGKVAAEKAIMEWGQPRSLITHLIFCTSAGVDMPSADFRLAKLLGLSPNVSRQCVYMQGCYAGGTVLRLAKDLAENNKGARVLAVCSELVIIEFRGLNMSHVDNVIGNGLFGDGASALIVGSDPIFRVERPVFEVVVAKQTFLPDSENSIHLHLREEGLTFHMSKDNPTTIASHIEQCLADAFAHMGSVPVDWNSLFWITHPGGRAILDLVSEKLKLHPEKLRASRHVLWEYGNMISACVFFIMDEMRKRSIAEGQSTTGEGLDWGVLLAFGPGITVETIILHSVPT